MFLMVSQLLKPAINLLFIVICTFKKGKFLFSVRVLLHKGLASFHLGDKARARTGYCLPHPYDLGFFVTQHDWLQIDQAKHALHLLISCSLIGFLIHRHLGIL